MVFSSLRRECPFGPSTAAILAKCVFQFPAQGMSFRTIARARLEVEAFQFPAQGMSFRTQSGDLCRPPFLFQFPAQGMSFRTGSEFLTTRESFSSLRRECPFGQTTMSEKTKKMFQFPAQGMSFRTNAPAQRSGSFVSVPCAGNVLSDQLSKLAPRMSLVSVPCAGNVLSDNNEYEFPDNEVSVPCAGNVLSDRGV